MAGESVGSIYAEASLDITKFQAAVGRLGGETDALALHLDRAAAGLADMQARLDGLSAAGFAESLSEGIRAHAWEADAQAAASALSGALVAAGPALEPAGQAAAAGLGAGLRGHGFAADAAAVSAAVVRGFSGAASLLSGVGASFSAGLAGGIRAGRSGVVAAAVSVAQAAAGAARAALQIHSPSRVTEGFGEHFDLGFVRGVENKLPAIDRAVARAVYVEPPSGAAYGRGAGIAGPGRDRARSAPIDYDRLAAAMDARPQYMGMNGRVFARLSAGDAARENNGRSQRVALGYYGLQRR